MSNWKYNTKWNGIVFGVLNNMEWKIDLKYNAEWMKQRLVPEENGYNKE